MTKNVNIAYKGSYTLTTEDVDQNGFNDFTAIYPNYWFAESSRPSKEYTQMMHLFGIEYLYHISNLPLSIKGSLLVGFSSTNIATDSFPTSSNGGTGAVNDPWRISDWDQKESSDSGLGIGAWIGVIYNFRQHFALYLDAGYIYSYYSGELSDSSIHGLSIVLGLRFSIYWKNRALDDQY